MANRRMAELYPDLIASRFNHQLVRGRYNRYNNEFDALNQYGFHGVNCKCPKCDSFLYRGVIMPGKELEITILNPFRKPDNVRLLFDAYNVSYKDEKYASINVRGLYVCKDCYTVFLKDSFDIPEKYILK